MAAPPRINWQRTEEVFLEALGRPPEDRAAYVAAACGPDETLRHEVESLLDAYAEQEQLNAAASRQSAAPSAAGRRFGPYETIRLLGQGGMGAVYLARRADGQFDQQVALKLIAGHLAGEFVEERFRLERQILAGLNHPNITRLLDGGVTADGQLYLAMEYVEGEPLTQFCGSRALTLGQRLRLFRDVCGAVQYAHQHLVIHRDLKPGNILVTADGAPKLLDFGTAKLLDPARQELTTGMALMTPSYASPEQLLANPVTTLSDVYSLGVILYELLCGERPFQAESGSLFELERAILENAPKKPSERAAGKSRRDLQGDLDKIAQKALEKDPAQRYGSVEQLSEDVRRYLEGIPVTARPGTWTYRAKKFLKRHALPAALVALTALSLMGATIYSARQTRLARLEAEKMRMVNQFLSYMFTSPSAQYGGKGRDVRLADVLDGATGWLDRGLVRKGEVEADVRTMIGDSYGLLGEYDKALKQLRLALAEELRVHGPNHSQTAAAYYLVGVTENNMGINFDEATSDLRAAYEILRRLGSKADPAAYFTALSGLCSSLNHQRDLSPGTEALFREAVAAAARVYGPRSYQSAMTYTGFGNFYLYRGELDKAERMDQNALAMLQALPGPPKEVATVKWNLGSVMLAREHWPEAERELGESLKATNQVWQPGPALKIQYEVIYEWAHANAGHAEEAERDLRAILATARKELGPDNWVTAFAETRLGQVQAMRGDAAGAEGALRHAVAIVQKEFKSDNSFKFTASYALGSCLLAEAKRQEAAALLEESYQGFLRMLGKSVPATIHAKEKLDEARRGRDKG